MFCVISVMAVNGSNPVTKQQAHIGPFNDPAYRKLSKINGDINKMTKEQMKEKLAHLHLDTRYCALFLSLNIVISNQLFKLFLTF